jgi:tetratricopeptide (TPR) repeat protein
MSELLKSLETHFVEGRYEKAIELLEGMRGDLSLGQYHYNMGSLYAQLEQLGPARYHLEQALNAGFVNTAVYNNLEIVLAKLPVRDLSTSTHFIDQLYSWLLSAPEGAYLSLSLLFALLLVLSFMTRYLAHNWLRWSLCVLLVIPVGTNQLYLKHLETVVSMQDSPVRVGPSQVYDQTYMLPAGAKVLIGEEAEGWGMISRPKALAGWVRLKNFGRL